MGLKELGYFFMQNLPYITLYFLLFLILKKINATDFMFMLYYIFIAWQIINMGYCAWQNLIYEE